MNLKYLFLALLSVTFLCSFKLVKVTDVNSYSYEISDDCKATIKDNISGLNEMNVIHYCVQLTSNYLEFSKCNAIDKGKANCVGYSKLCKSMCQYAFQENGMYCKVRHVRGYVSGWGLNLCDLATRLVPAEYKNYVKDHDFIEIELCEMYIYIDPSLYDLINDDCITIKYK